MQSSPFGIRDLEWLYQPADRWDILNKSIHSQTRITMTRATTSLGGTASGIVVGKVAVCGHCIVDWAYSDTRRSMA